MRASEEEMLRWGNNKSRDFLYDYNKVLITEEEKEKKRDYAKKYYLERKEKEVQAELEWAEEVCLEYEGEYYG